MEHYGDGSVVVVGGGILGCSIAVHLIDRGVRPVLIGPQRPGQGASTGSFASISALGKDPASYFQLACAGVASWPRFAERLGEVGLRWAGEVRWASDPEGGRRLAALLAASRQRATRSARSAGPSWPSCCRRPASGRWPPPASPLTTGRWSRRWSWRPAGPYLRRPGLGC